VSVSGGGAEGGWGAGGVSFTSHFGTRPLCFPFWLDPPKTLSRPGNWAIPAMPLYLIQI